MIFSASFTQTLFAILHLHWQNNFEPAGGYTYAIRLGRHQNTSIEKAEILHFPISACNVPDRSNHVPAAFSLTRCALL
jgi:hypothetical protein